MKAYESYAVRAKVWAVLAGDYGIDIALALEQLDFKNR